MAFLQLYRALPWLCIPEKVALRSGDCLALSASYKHCGKLFPPPSACCIIFNPLSLQLADYRAFTIWICIHEDCGDLPPCHLLHDCCERRLFVLPFQSCEIAAGYTTSEFYLYRRRRRRIGDASLRLQCKKPMRKLTRGEDEHLCVTEGVKILHVTLALNFVPLYQRSSIQIFTTCLLVAS